MVRTIFWHLDIILDDRWNKLYSFIRDKDKYENFIIFLKTILGMDI